MTPGIFPRHSGEMVHIWTNLRRGEKSMNVRPQFGSDEESAARRLIEQAGTILKGLRGDMPESFASTLFAGATPEDLVRYEPRELAELAEAAWLFLQDRLPIQRQPRSAALHGPMLAQ